MYSLPSKKTVLWKFLVNTTLQTIKLNDPSSYQKYQNKFIKQAQNMP